MTWYLRLDGHSESYCQAGAVTIKDIGSTISWLFRVKFNIYISVYGHAIPWHKRLVYRGHIFPICIVTLPIGPFIHIYTTRYSSSTETLSFTISLRHIKPIRIRLTVHILIQREANSTVSIFSNSNTHKLNIAIPLPRIEGIIICITHLAALRRRVESRRAFEMVLLLPGKASSAQFEGIPALLARGPVIRESVGVDRFAILVEKWESSWVPIFVARFAGDGAEAPGWPFGVDDLDGLAEVE